MTHVGTQFLQANDVVEVHFTGEIAKPCETDEAAMWRPTDGVAVGTSELKDGLASVVVQRGLTRHIACRQRESVH